MPIYLTSDEKARILQLRASPTLNHFYWVLYRRVNDRAATPGLMNSTTTAEWWYVTQEFITDAALLYALDGDAVVGTWLRDCMMSIVHRPVSDWVGPFFRDHDLQPAVGNLETAHLSLALSVAYDLARGAFKEAELAEIETCLREVALPLCTRWLDRTTHINNWRCVLLFGLAATAVVLKDETAIQRALSEFKTCVQLFQEDGTYGESLGYAGYAANALMLTYETLVRYRPTAQAELTIEPYARSVHWIAQSLLYRKPLAGWGPYPMARMANFNDSAAIFRPNGDLLLHIAVRVRNSLPGEAALARWLFDTLYVSDPSGNPGNPMTYGFSNHFGFLTLVLLAEAPAGAAREETEPLLARFSCGDALARDAWNGRTILAARTASDPLATVGHLHGDIHSFILVHNQERLLVDPGHSCYRDLIHQLEISSQTHNTCTFTVEPEISSRRPEDLLSAEKLQQRTEFQRKFSAGHSGPLVERGGKFLLAAAREEVKVIGSEAAGVYGAPLQTFQRFWLLAGGHVLFIVDHIETECPVRTTWNWLFNNRDQALELKTVRPDRIVARRGNAGMKLFHLGDGQMQGPVYAYVHDAQNTLPAQPSEGIPGSGLLMRWNERRAQTERTVLHAIAMDDYGGIGAWHLRQVDGLAAIEGPGGSQQWVVQIEEKPLRISLRETKSGRSFQVAATAGVWELK